MTAVWERDRLLHTLAGSTIVEEGGDNCSNQCV